MKKTVLTFTLLSLTLAYPQGVRPGFDANSLAANDDGSTGLIPFGFTVDFFGLERDSAYLNNNGNITFNSPLSTFTPDTVDLEEAQIIAPFFGDVDTRGAGSQLMTYQQGTLFNHDAFFVNWVDVGYYSSRVDLLNSFQLILIDRSDVAPGAFDIEFNYDKIQWETGEASEGVNGLGGSSARVVYSNGIDNVFELEGSAVNGALLDTGPNALVRLTNVNEPGRYLLLVRNGEFSNEIPFTDADSASIQSGLALFSSMMGSDINNRVSRMRTGVVGDRNTEGHGVRYNSNPQEEDIIPFKFDFFGAYNYNSYTRGENVLLNSAGKATSVIPEVELSSGVGTLGVEMSLEGLLHLGLAGISSRGSLSTDGGGLDADLEGLGWAAYASLYFTDLIGNGDLFLDAAYTQTSGELTTDRALSIANYDLGNTIRSDGSSDYNSSEITFNAGMTFSLGSLRHGPYLQYRSIDFEADSYTDSGGGAWEGGLFPGLESDSQILQTGYSLAYSMQGTLSRFYPNVRVGYEQELSDPEFINGSKLASAPDAAWVLGGGFTYDPGISGNGSVDLEYKKYDEDLSGLSVMVSARLTF